MSSYLGAKSRQPPSCPDQLEPSVGQNPLAAAQRLLLPE